MIVMPEPTGEPLPAPMGESSRRVDPRIIRSRQTVLEAALAELADVGYGAFTIDSVATRAGVARSTIYRLWPDKVALIADAFDTLNVQPRRPTEAIEPSRQQIVRMVEHLADVMRGSIFSACLPALIDGAERDRQVRAFHHDYNDRRRAALVSAIASAIDAGEVSGEIDAEMAALAIAGAVIYRRLMADTPLAQSEVGPLISTVIGPPPPARPRQPKRRARRTDSTTPERRPRRE
jgi:AcrR family transcriptional regulator